MACKVFLASTPFNTIAATGLLHPSMVPLFKTSKVLLIYLLRCPSSSIEVMLQMYRFADFYLKLTSNFLVKRASFLFNAAFTKTIMVGVWLYKQFVHPMNNHICCL